MSVNQTLTKPREDVYTPPASEVEEEDEKAAESVSLVSEILTWVFLGVCLVAWAGIGLFLWIPRLARSMVKFSVALVQATITDSSAEAAARDLRSAADFYQRGFRGAVGAIRSTRGQPPEGRPGIEAGPIMREFAWAMIFWYLVLWAMGVSVWTPADFWAAFSEIPWQELWNRVTQSLAEMPETVDGLLTGA